MTKPNSDDGVGVLLEQIIHQNQVILENLTDMQKNVDKIPHIAEDINQLKTDVKTIKKAVTDTNLQVTDHESRITLLEQTA